MTETLTAGGRFRKALAEEKPLQIMGTINAYCAIDRKSTRLNSSHT